MGRKRQTDGRRRYIFDKERGEQDEDLYEE